MRSSFISWLLDYCSDHDNCYLLVADLGFSVIEEFAIRFPDQFLNVGIAEQNMAGIAAGIASQGNQVFCYSIGNFTTFRCAEQIRNDIDYHKLPVCMVSVGGGVAYGAMGYSHHAIQDIGLMRLMPNTLICAPADPIETSLCLEEIIRYNGPSYLRLHKTGEPVLGSDSQAIEDSKSIRLIAGTRSSPKAILTTGFTAQLVYRQIAKGKIPRDYSLYTMPFWGGSHGEDEFYALMNSMETIHVVEDHLANSGFTGWCLEKSYLLGSTSKLRLHSFSTDIVGEVGDEDYLIRKDDLIGRLLGELNT